MALVPSGRCAAHAVNRHKAYDQGRRRDDPALAEAARIRGSSQWKEVRALLRAKKPLCCDPFNVEGRWKRPTFAGHHITPLIERPDLAFDWENLAPLCSRCHAKIEAMERQGEQTRHLFENQIASPLPPADAPTADQFPQT